MLASLPSELLIDIFEASRCDPVQLSAVCARWRRVALENAAFWTKIVVKDACARGYSELDRARAFASRARSLPLDVIRHATTKRVRVDRLERLDGVVLELFPRCQTFAYVDMREDDSRSRRKFVAGLLRMQAPLLLELVLKTHDDSDPVSLDGTPLPTAADNLPVLHILILERICIPLQDMNVCGLQRFELDDTCETQACSVRSEFPATIGSILRASPGMKILDLYRYDGDVDFTVAQTRDKCVHIADALHESLESLTIQAIPLFWPDDETLHSINLARLTTLVISVGGNAPETRVILQMLECAPSLHSLTLRTWLAAPIGAAPARHVLLAQLQMLDLDGVHEQRVEQLLDMLDLPALDALTFSPAWDALPVFPPLPVRRATLRIAGRLSASIGPSLSALTRLQVLRVESAEHRDDPLVPADILSHNIAAMSVVIVACLDIRMDSARRAMRARPGLQVSLEPCPRCIASDDLMSGIIMGAASS